MGSPIKDVVCLSSKLNLANRKAENAAITNAKYGRILRSGSMKDGYSIVNRSVNTIEAGATPNVTSSASESSSLPIGEETPNKRALIPSKKSNTAPMTIKRNAILAEPERAKVVAIHPDTKLQQVNVFGIILVIQLLILILVLQAW